MYDAIGLRWGRSSAGRAAALHAAGRRFESGRLHQTYPPQAPTATSKIEIPHPNGPAPPEIRKSTHSPPTGHRCVETEPPTKLPTPRPFCPRKSKFPATHLHLTRNSKTQKIPAPLALPLPKIEIPNHTSLPNRKFENRNNPTQPQVFDFRSSIFDFLGRRKEWEGYFFHFSLDILGLCRYIIVVA